MQNIDHPAARTLRPSDTRQRPRPDPNHAVLARLAELEAANDAFRAENARLRTGLAEARLTTEAGLGPALEGAGLGAWDRHLRTGAGAWSARMADLHGAAPNAAPSYDEWLTRVHPDDRAALHAAMADTLAGTSASFEVTYRYRRPDGATRWIWCRGAVVERDPGGAPLRIAGVARDDTERREADERRDLLAREVNHRAKNALAVVQAVLRLTRAETATDFADAVSGRIAALARAHDLLARSTWAGADLHTVITQELAPFVEPGAIAPGTTSLQRVTLIGPPVTLASAAAQPVTMALHELATNAAKHGALSVADGRVSVRWWIEAASHALRLLWVELGGPALAGRPNRLGFGTRVLEGTVRGQLGGTSRIVWEPEGLVCDLRIPAQHVAGWTRTEAADG